MEKFLKNYTAISVISSIGLLVFGVVSYLIPKATLVTLSYMVGVLLVSLGIVSLINYIANNKEKLSYIYDTVYGVMNIIVGILMIFRPTLMTTVFPTIMGLWIIIVSMIKLQLLLRIKEVVIREQMMAILISVVTGVLGFVLVFNPFEGAVFITKIIAIFIVLYAVLDFLQIVIFRSYLDKKECKT